MDERHKSEKGCPVGWSVFCVWVLIALILLTFAWHCWPVLDGDSIAFVPPMLTYAKGQGLINRAFAMASVYDLTGQGRLVYHGFLYQMVIGTLTPKPTYPLVIFTMAVLETLTLAGCAFLFYRTLTLVSRRRAWWQVALLGFSLMGVATAVVGLRGRPEPFAMLILVWGTNFLLLLRWRWHWLVAGGALGLLAVAHPVGAILAGLATALYGSVRCPTKVWVPWLGEVGLASLSFFALGMAWYPYHFREWIGGLVRHSEVMVLPARWGLAFDYWFLSPRATFYGFLFVLGLGAAIYLRHRYKGRVHSPWGFRLLCASLAGVGYFYGVRAPVYNYNLQVLTPLVCSLIIAAVLVWDETGGKLGRAWPQKLLVLGVLALSSLGFLQKVALFPFFLSHGMTYQQARTHFEESRRSLPGPVSAGGSMFTLTEDYGGLTFGGGHPAGVSVAFFPQVNNGLISAPKWAGFELVEDYFCPLKPCLLGLPLANTVGGYNFAVYRTILRGQASPAGACGQRVELALIWSHPIKDHIILVDDARLFDGTACYRALAFLSGCAASFGWSCEVRDDIIRFLWRSRQAA